MAKYLIEIGTEELPYKFIPSAMEQIKDSLSKTLKENRITFKNITTYGTPRRLTAIIEDISESQPDLVKEIKGPPANVAFDDSGNLTPAGVGFAKKQDVNPEKLYKKAVGEVEYVFVNLEEKGKNTPEALQSIIPSLILKLQGSHFMRWGDLEVKFSRPIRWIVSLMDDKEVKIKIGNVESTKYSRGNRFYKDREILITSPDTYLDELYKAQVIADQEKRQNEVVKLAQNIATENHGSVAIDPELVKEITYIVEWPVPVLGSFDKKYLVVPKEVIITVMASHQRYLPVFSKDGSTLLNNFITMANYNSKSPENVKQGNERVIKARLDDAIFFYTEDRKRSLESRLEDLKGMTFQKGLGSVYDKTSRIQKISEFISEQLKLDKNLSQKISKSALLCKADLITTLVREFTELQGVIGGEYAKLDGNDELISEGIKEHYLPLSADGNLAKTITGQIVGIADKIDTICGVFALGKAPTGSADPLGLRRASLGILLTLIKENINVNLTEIIKNAISVQPVAISDKTKLENDIREFIIQRLRISLNEAYKYDVTEAVLAAKDPLKDIKDVIERINILSKLVKKPNYASFHESANRIQRIIKAEAVTTTPDKSLFKDKTEEDLFTFIEKIPTEISYEELVKNLEQSIPFIEKFFDNVLVMDPQESVKNNRIALLALLRDKFLKIADFSKIVF